MHRCKVAKNTQRNEIVPILTEAEWMAVQVLIPGQLYTRNARRWLLGSIKVRLDVDFTTWI